MINVTIRESEKKSDNTYPYVGKSNTSEAIVLFTELGVGVCLDDVIYHTGKYCRTLDGRNFTPITGEIVIRNGMK